jgi:hypothetical protein
LGQILELDGKLKGKNFIFKVASLTKQCDSYLTASEIRPHMDGIEAVLSLACGAGVQTVAELFPELPIFPAQNTLFIGTEEREDGTFSERCSACGDCILAETGGICPITRCAKGLLNGPCGGASNGKCEVDPEKDCAWHLIIERLGKLGRLDALEEIRPPRNFKVVLSPGRVKS